MSTWRIKNKEYKSLKSFKPAKKGQLKIGDVYYWKCPHKNIITNELQYDKYCIDSHIDRQIDNGLIYIRD